MQTFCLTRGVNQISGVQRPRCCAHTGSKQAARCNSFVAMTLTGFLAWIGQYIVRRVVYLWHLNAMRLLVKELWDDVPL